MVDEVVVKAIVGHHKDPAEKRLWAAQVEIPGATFEVYGLRTQKEAIQKAGECASYLGWIIQRPWVRKYQDYERKVPPPVRKIK